MRYSRIGIERYGALNGFSLENLSHGVNVIWSRDDAMRSSIPCMLRKICFGFTGWNRDLISSEHLHDAGSVSFCTGMGIRTLRREVLSSSAERTQLQDDSGRALDAPMDVFPAWVSADAFTHILCPETSHPNFDALARLCSEANQIRVRESELRIAELAIDHTVQERDGNGVCGGLVHRITELRRRQGEILSEIAALRKPSQEPALRLESHVRELTELTSRIDRLHTQIASIETQIHDLELQLSELRHQLSIPLSRTALEEEIRFVGARVDRWKTIEAELLRERDILTTSSGSMSPTASESASCHHSIRAIVRRVEQRLDSVAADDVHSHEIHRALRKEIAVLCQFLSAHELSDIAALHSTLQATTDRCLSDASRTRRQLELRFEWLQKELHASDNILALEGSLPSGSHSCQFSGHTDAASRTAPNGDIVSVETRLAALHRDLSRLISERDTLITERRTIEVHIEKLRQEQSSALTLEQLDELRAGYAELDAEVTLLEEDRRQLDRTEQTLRETLRRLQQGISTGVFQLASQYLKRMTNNECFDISVTRPYQIGVSTRWHSEPVPVEQLNQTTAELVGLALRMACVRVHAERSAGVPIVLNSSGVNSDDSVSRSVAELLMDLAREGQQILFLTSKREVADLFAGLHADVRYPEAPAARPVAVPVVVPPVAPLHAWVEPAPEPPPVVAAPQPVQLLSENVASGTTNWLYYLEMDYGIEDLAGITLGELEALRASGVIRIEHLLGQTIPQLESLTREKGFLVPVERLQALRGQADLATRIPMLRRGDAGLLFAAGIHSPEELARLRPETVFDRVTEFQRSDAGARYRRAGRLIDRQQALNWARFGQFGRSLDEARQSRSRFGVRPATSPSGRPGIDTPHRPRAAAPVAVEGTSPASEGSATTPTTRRRKKAPEASTTEERRARRQARRARQTERLKAPESAGESEHQPAERVGGMRFFLSRTSDVERAPSIGPRTADLLRAIGVRTVEELLSMAPERISDKLAQKRLTPTVVQQWQSQARLMCQIPELRGHDAQILVAIGILTPEALATRTPDELLAVVQPFTRSAEGERILRNGRHPDLSEVTDWIQWAANARPMKAA